MRAAVQFKPDAFDEFVAILMPGVETEREQMMKHIASLHDLDTSGVEQMPETAATRTVRVG